MPPTGPLRARSPRWRSGCGRSSPTSCWSTTRAWTGWAASGPARSAACSAASRGTGRRRSTAAPGWPPPPRGRSTRSSGARRSTRSGPASRTASRPSVAGAARRGADRGRAGGPTAAERPAQRAGTEGRRRVRGLRRGVRLPRRPSGDPGRRRRLVLPAIVRRELAELERLPASRAAGYFEALGPRLARATGAATSRRPRAAPRIAVRLVERGDWPGAGPCTRRSTSARRSPAAAARSRGAAGGRSVRPAAADSSATIGRGRGPIDPDLAVFAAYWYRGYACNPRAIYEKARELAPGVRGVWVVKPEAVAALPAPESSTCMPGTREYYDADRPRALISQQRQLPRPPGQARRDRARMTHHGTPLKRMGLDLRDTPVAGRRMDFAALLRRCDAVGLQPLLERLLHARVGARLPDPLPTLRSATPQRRPRDRHRDDVARIRAGLGIEPGAAPSSTRRPTASTRRATSRCSTSPRWPTASGPITSSWRGCTTSTAPTRPGELHRRDGSATWPTIPSVEELSLAADVLVTDYSSLMFDFAVLDRPIVIHAPDWEVYRNAARHLLRPAGRAARCRHARGADLAGAALGRTEDAAARRRAPRSARASARRGRPRRRARRAPLPGARAATRRARWR